MAEGKLRTDETESRDVSETPDYLKPYTEISDLDDVDVTPVDTGVDKATTDLFDSGSDVLIVDGKDVSEELKTSYQLEMDAAEASNCSEEACKKMAEKEFEKYVKQQNKAAKENKTTFTYSDEDKKQYMDDYVKWIMQRQSNTNSENSRFNAFAWVINNKMETKQQMNQAIDQAVTDAESENRIKEAILSMQNVDFEYLTRGAILRCTSGAALRRLNLPRDHGVFYGPSARPIVNKHDCIAGDDNNIANFGLCHGSNPPSEEITIDSITLKDDYGYNLSEPSDSIVTGFRCIPEIVSPGWINTHSETDMGKYGNESVSTKSVLVCIHGGMIYPLTSGQHELRSLPKEELDDAEMSQQFNAACERYKAFANAYNILDNTDHDPAYEYNNSYLHLFDKKPYQPKKTIETQKIELQDAQNMEAKKIKDLLDQMRYDSYGGEFEDISEERKKTLQDMLSQNTELFGGDDSVLNDYENYEGPMGRGS